MNATCQQLDFRQHPIIAVGTILGSYGLITLCSIALLAMESIECRSISVACGLVTPWLSLIDPVQSRCLTYLGILSSCFVVHLGRQRCIHSKEMRDVVPGSHNHRNETRPECRKRMGPPAVQEPSPALEIVATRNTASNTHMAQWVCRITAEDPDLAAGAPLESCEQHVNRVEHCSQPDRPKPEFRQGIWGCIGKTWLLGDRHAYAPVPGSERESSETSGSCSSLLLYAILASPLLLCMLLCGIVWLVSLCAIGFFVLYAPYGLVAVVVPCWGARYAPRPLLLMLCIAWILLVLKVAIAKKNPQTQHASWGQFLHARARHT